MPAVNASTIGVAVDGVNYSVPVAGFGEPSISQENAGRRLLADALLNDAFPANSAHRDSGSQRALLQNSDADTDPSSSPVYEIQLTISKCNASLPVTDARVRAVPRCKLCISANFSS